MSQKIVVVGYGYTSRLGIIRALGEKGYDVNILAVEPVKECAIDRYSKYVNACYCSGGNKEKVILNLLLDKFVDNQQKVVLIPVNDFSAKVIDNNQSVLKEHFLFPHIHQTAGAIEKWMDKSRQKGLAKSLGLHIANSVDVEIEHGKYTLPEGIQYPCFTKTRAYINGYKHTLHRCNNEKELREVLNRLSQRYKNLTIMIEDYMQIEKEFAVVGFSDGSNVVIPGVIEIMQMAKGDDKGVACPGKIMPVNGFEDLIEKFRKLILEIGLVGLFDIDFYSCKGLFYFGEVNLRIGGSGSAVIKMGVNLPEMLVRSLKNEKIDDLKTEITRSAIYVNERICEDNWFNCYFSKKHLKKLMRESDISFLKDKDDPKPYEIFQESVRGKSFKRNTKNRLKRFLKLCLQKEKS